jgi:hypothetical protein
MHLGLGAAFAAATVCLAATAAVAQGKVPTPPAGLLDTFPGCQWGEVKAATLSIWSLSCGPQSGNAHLIGDDKLPGFVLETGGADGTSRKIVIRAFTKSAKAPIVSVLPAIRAASPGADTDTCTLVRFNDDDAKHFARSAQTFTFEPTGAAKTAWDKAEKEGGDTPAPCGDLGIYFDRAPLFWVLRGDPTTVIAADMGSEIQIFDPATLRRVK